jgi:hypothetical protein
MRMDDIFGIVGRLEAALEPFVGMPVTDDVVYRVTYAAFKTCEREIEASLLAQLCGPMGHVAGHGELTALAFADRDRATIVARADLVEWPELWRSP